MDDGIDRILNRFLETNADAKVIEVVKGWPIIYDRPALFCSC
jgi:hypothetical protein